MRPQAAAVVEGHTAPVDVTVEALRRCSVTHSKAHTRTVMPLFGRVPGLDGLMLGALPGSCLAAGAGRLFNTVTECERGLFRK